MPDDILRTSKDVRNDYILLDDIQQIMVVPHLDRKKKWIPYDEIDKLRKVLNPRFPRMIYTYNEMGSWIKRTGIKLAIMKGEVDAKSDRDNL